MAIRFLVYRAPGYLALCVALALATAACRDSAAPTPQQVEDARHSVLVNATAGNPDIPPNLPELIALGRNLENEQQESIK